MIKYRTKDEEEGICLLLNRFRCSFDVNYIKFIRRRRNQYRKALEFCLMLSLILGIVFFQAWKRFERRGRVFRTTQILFTVEEIPQTQQPKLTPAPSLPKVPIASEDETLPEDETIEFTELDLEAEPPLPPPPSSTADVDEDVPIFVPYDEPPYPIGGYEAILQNVKYPEIARLAGVEGRVILHVRIDDDGSVGKILVVKSLLADLDKEAMDAVRSVKWMPAKQRDMPLTVWLMVPIIFELTELEES